MGAKAPINTVMYRRVIPRDLFNEAKLLKCMGQLALLIHDGVGVPRGLELVHDDSVNQGFVIEQDDSDGSLFVSNLTLRFKGRVIVLKSPYNSRDCYPLWYGPDDEQVFNDDGSFATDFLSSLTES